LNDISNAKKNWFSYISRPIKPEFMLLKFSGKFSPKNQKHD
jgi:hypothetical protein